MNKWITALRIHFKHIYMFIFIRGHKLHLATIDKMLNSYISFLSKTSSVLFHVTPRPQQCCSQPRHSRTAFDLQALEDTAWWWCPSSWTLLSLYPVYVVSKVSHLACIGSGDHMEEVPEAVHHTSRSSFHFLFHAMGETVCTHEGVSWLEEPECDVLHQSWVSIDNTHRWC